MKNGLVIADAEPIISKDEEHRLICQVKDDEILIATCRFHSD